VPSSSYYDYKRQLREAAQGRLKQKRGPKVQLDDASLLKEIKLVIKHTPFVTEGVKKVYFRLRKKSIKADRGRINRLMRDNDLLSPQRYEGEKKDEHNGTIIPDGINQMWGTDATMFGLLDGSLLWLFAVIDHFSDEILGWHIAKVGQGNSFAALEPIKQGLRKTRGATGKDVGKGIAIRHDWGPQYVATDFKDELKFFGLKNSPALIRQPQTNGVIERFFRTLKEECIWLEDFSDINQASEVIGDWMELYNTQWIIARNNYQTPREVREASEKMQEVA
jgi:putative transposase